ncbi:MAG TPA: BON domain-containing protein [Chitinophagaceae bacterium]|nr:BON domain-containing protein [Chitinophagaceae bacterium]
MSEKNRNRSSYMSDENWEQHQGNQDQQSQYRQQGQFGNQGQASYGGDAGLNRNRQDYGEYGSSGSGYENTGQGRYGSGYDNDYNRFDQNRYGSNYGSDYGSSHGNRYEGGHGGNYGQGGQGSYGQSNYGQGNYGQGNYGQSGQYGRRDDYRGGYGNQGMNYGNRYGSSGEYGNRGYDDGSGYRNTNYGTGYGTSNRGNWQNQGNRGEDRGWWERTRDEVSSWFGDEDAERRRRMDHVVRGEHKGKGPKDYRRSDDRIREDVCDRLSDDPFIDASGIDVKVDSSEVVLTGTVQRREDKRRAEDLVESISGVTNVQNNLRVSSDATREYSPISGKNRADE